MQAAFRAQNPCLFQENGQYYRKENAYVFDFDPARTLTIFEEFANDLSLDTSDGRFLETGKGFAHEKRPAYTEMGFLYCLTSKQPSTLEL